MLELEHVSKYYGKLAALRDVSVTAADSEIVCLLGPSGCGKSTLLRIVAGLERADSGRVCFDGRQINDLPTHQRGFGLMFQDYALFPHRTVAENIAFGLRMQHSNRAATQRRVDELLDLIGLAGYGPRRVDQLSGGERQRVALARSLAPNPRLLMLDEPLGALDRALRERLLDELREILKRIGVTSLYVTHDQAEAFALADTLVLMNAGNIEQLGPPQAVYERPATLFAARFLGLTNMLEATVVATNGSQALITTPIGQLYAQAQGIAPGMQGTAVIRPEAARLAPQHGAANAINATVVARSFRGSRTRVTVSMTNHARLEFELDSGDIPPAGSPVTLALRPEAIHLIPNTPV